MALSVAAAVTACGCRTAVPASCLGGLEVDHQLELGGLHDRQVGRFGTLENSAGVDGLDDLYEPREPAASNGMDARTAWAYRIGAPGAGGGCGGSRRMCRPRASRG